MADRAFARVYLRGGHRREVDESVARRYRGRLGGARGGCLREGRSLRRRRSATARCWLGFTHFSTKEVAQDRYKQLATHWTKLVAQRGVRRVIRHILRSKFYSAPVVIKFEKIHAPLYYSPKARLRQCPRSSSASG